MKKLSTYSIAFVLSIISITAYGQLDSIEIAAITTDNTIDLDFTAGDTVKHQIFLKQSIPSKNKLLLFLPGTGAKPKDHYSEFLKTAANEDYHAIGLVYKNTTSVSQTCGTGTPSSSPTCSEDLRMEIIYGTPLSVDVAVDSANSIMNRLTKLLYYLEVNYPTKGWDNYIDTLTMDIHWQNIALAGHSQGGGHAALIARDTVVNRVLFFNCPSDVDTNLATPLNQPQWFSDPHITPDSVYYAFYHQQNGGADRLAVYNHFGLGNYGTEANIDTITYPYNNSHILYTDSATFDFGTYLGNSCGTSPTFNPHSDIIVDCELALDNFGNNPYEIVWQYMLNNNVSNVVSGITEQIENISVTVFPNPTTGQFTIEGLSDNSTVRIYSSTGRLLKLFENNSTIDLSPYSDGIYLIHIQVDDKYIIRKVVKKSA